MKKILKKEESKVVAKSYKNNNANYKHSSGNKKVMKSNNQNKDIVSQ